MLEGAPTSVFMLINAICNSLENMNKKFTNLSRLRFDEIYGQLKEKIESQKIQERPFAYEFYHQFRKLWESGYILTVVPENIVIQAEVNKRYQNIPNLDKMPDFLLHRPYSNQNFAVIEFKLASNCGQIKYDFDKLYEFKKIGYEYVFEVVVGEKTQLSTAKQKINSICNHVGERIDIVEFDTELWRANHFKVKFEKNPNKK